MMNADLLKTVLSRHLESQPVNKYFSNFNGTQHITGYYASTLPNVTTKVKGKRIDLFYKDQHMGSIVGQTVSTNEQSAAQISSDKFEAERHLDEKGISTTSSRLYSPADYEEAFKYVRASSTPKVIKPTNMSGAKGITMDVDERNFDFAWTHCIRACRTAKKEPEILVQDQLSGIEVRALVVEGIFNSAVLRVPAHIVGDGVQTVSQLIEEKNSLKKLNPHQRIRPINMDDNAMRYLKNEDLALDDIPEKSRYIFLHHTSNISMGGDPYEVSDLISPEIRLLAEEAVKAIPGLNTAGVDIMITSLQDKHPVVLEINSSANLRLHHYPFKGPFRTPIYNFIYALTIPYL